VSIDNPSSDPPLHTVALEGHSEIMVSLNMDEMNFKFLERILTEVTAAAGSSLKAHLFVQHYNTDL
jgi:hypothetical protein